MFKLIAAQFKKHICPYCFEDFELKSSPFRCANDPLVCSPEPDEVYKEKWKSTLPMGKVINPKGVFIERFSKSRTCTACDQKSYDRLCPHCHSNLPANIGEQENMIFAVIGARGTGKSHYLTVLIEQISKVVGPAHGILLEPLNDETINRYRKDFYDPIYTNKGTIAVTKSGRVANPTGGNVRQPLVYTLAVTAENWNGDMEVSKAVTLVFYDTAGEDLDSKNNMSVMNKYIYRSNGIIVLIDPLQLPYVRDELSSDTPLPPVDIETADILIRTTRLIEEGQKLSTKDKIKTPLAVSFSKFDAVLPLVDEQSPLHDDANHDHGYDHADFEAVNGEMLSLLDCWGCKNIINLAQTRYRHVGFFGLSALGCNPHSSNTVEAVVPKRVEDPLLWLLVTNNIIPRGDSDEA